MNLFQLEGRRALVCGSTQGIGLASAMMLADQGAEVILMARNEEALKDLCKEHERFVGYIPADFSKVENVRHAISSYPQKNKIDILVNNSGGPASGPIVEADLSQFIAAFEQHLLCNHILVQSLLPFMKERRFGRIINIISTSIKLPLPNLGVSNTVRAAVGNWSKTLANELAQYDITVNNVLPGATNTQRLQSIIHNKANKLQTEISHINNEMIAEIPMGRFADAKEIAAAVVFLASDAAAYITGINIPVDGGRTGCL